MRIISKFADVYDLQSSLFDADRVWERKSDEVTVKVTDKAEENLIHRRQVFGGRDEYSYSEYYIKPLFIAGEVFWLHSFYDRYGVANFQTFDIDKMFKHFEELGLSVRIYFTDKDSNNVKATLQDALVESKAKAEKILSELRVPIAFLKSMKKNENDEGKHFVIQTNIRFHQSGLPWQEVESNLYRFHQQLEMYIFGVLGTGEPDTITVSDKDRLLAHGFDVKKSFRNMGR